MFRLWVQIRSSLWFVPALFVSAAIVLALSLVKLDIVFARELSARSWSTLLNAGADGARGVLMAIAGSMITVAATAFSITIVALSLASTQYTPRILRNFMRDRGNQNTLGMFMGTFVYCLVVLRTVRGSEGTSQTFVPLLAVFSAVVLVLIAVGFLIYFIHHIAASIQASHILDVITRETLGAIDAQFPDETPATEEEADGLQERPGGLTWYPVAARAFGYLQHLNEAGLLTFASAHEITLRLERSVGNFIVEGAPLVSATRALDESEAGELRAHFVLGDFRTVEQDPSFGLRQIVDVALKALSPGVNDTSTAVSCLDYLSVILSRLARRQLSVGLREEGGPVRVEAPTVDFPHFVGTAFDEIRLSADGNVTILLHLTCAIQRVAFATRSPARKAVLAKHAGLVAAAADRTVREPYDRRRLNVELEDVRRTLGLAEVDFPLLQLDRPHAAVP